tara:strand:+ start:22811 stop:23194 length:384 start_codon:yes stop_codon:yes gene_type:complete
MNKILALLDRISDLFDLSLPPSPVENVGQFIFEVVTPEEGLVFAFIETVSSDADENVCNGMKAEELHRATQLEMGEKVDGACAICLEECDGQACKRLLKCRHKFHAKCLDLWVVDQHTCPLCRSDLL